jgi:hypothetical protein
MMYIEDPAEIAAIATEFISSMFLDRPCPWIGVAAF